MPIALDSLETAQSLLINGEPVPGDPALAPLRVRYPADQATEVGSCAVLGPAQVSVVSAAAQQAFCHYRQATPETRRDILLRLAALLEGEAAELARLITLESGKPVRNSQAEVRRAIALCHSYARELEITAYPILRVEGRACHVRQVPVGPVLAITPFNFPLNLVMHKLAPAIAAGCALVVKPSPRTPLTALALGRLAREAGYPALSVVPTDDPAVIRALVAAPEFRLLTFTGSAHVGWELRALAGNKPVTLELGGNAACVLEAPGRQPLADIAGRLARAAFGYSGQTCVSLQRLLVRHDHVETLLPALIEATRALKVGDPLLPDTDIGPLISLDALQRTRNMIRQALHAGANVLYGGNTYNVHTLNPTLLNRTTPDMAVNREECFAPIMTVTPYERFEDALSQVNDSRYGLQAGVYTDRPEQVRLAFETLEVGGLVVNDVPTTRLDELPFGGVKDSGLGREGVLCGVAGMSHTRTLVFPPGEDGVYP